MTGTGRLTCLWILTDRGDGRDSSGSSLCLVFHCWRGPRAGTGWLGWLVVSIRPKSQVQYCVCFFLSQSCLSVQALSHVLSHGVRTASVCICLYHHLNAHYKSLKLMFVISPSVSTQWHLSWLPLLCLCNEWIEIKTEREKCCVDFCTEFRIKEKH